MNDEGEATGPIEVEEAISRLRSTIPASRETVAMRITDEDLLGRVYCQHEALVRLQIAA